VSRPEDPIVGLIINELGYAYGPNRVLRGVTADFSGGATVLLGPNGAGKSTLLELIASLRFPDEGSVKIEGIEYSQARRAERSAYRRSIAWLPQKFVPFPGLKVREQVAYSGWLKGMSKSDAWEKSRNALDFVSLSARASDPVKNLSGGQQKRVGIAGALVHDAKVLLLDEPTAGLDPSQRKMFRNVLESIAQERTLIVSSHDADDAHSSYGRVAVLRAGELVFFGSVGDFVADTPSTMDARDRVEVAYTTLVGIED
jgi:ABC-2 type transport system ATP-binding protein